MHGAFNTRKFATKLIAARGEKSLRTVAKECGIAYTTYLRLENGYPPDVSTFAKLCYWLQCDPREYL